MHPVPRAVPIPGDVVTWDPPGKFGKFLACYVIAYVGNDEYLVRSLRLDQKVTGGAEPVRQSFARRRIWSLATTYVAAPLRG